MQPRGACSSQGDKLDQGRSRNREVINQEIGNRGGGQANANQRDELALQRRRVGTTKAVAGGEVCTLTMW